MAPLQGSSHFPVKQGYIPPQLAKAFSGRVRLKERTIFNVGVQRAIAHKRELKRF
jgi:hypothetical protein